METIDYQADEHPVWAIGFLKIALASSGSALSRPATRIGNARVCVCV
jgi:hypothetical protein